MATIIDIAKALAEELNASEGLSMEFTAAMTYMPTYTQQELDDLKVSVVPSALSLTPITRGTELNEFTIDVGVQKNVDVTSGNEIDGLIGFVKELADYIRNCELTGVDDARWSKSSIEPVYSVSHLVEHKCFTSVIKVTYKAVL